MNIDTVSSYFMSILPIFAFYCPYENDPHPQYFGIPRTACPKMTIRRRIRSGICCNFTDAMDSGGTNLFTHPRIALHMIIFFFSKISDIRLSNHIGKKTFIKQLSISRFWKISRKYQNMISAVYRYCENIVTHGFIARFLSDRYLPWAQVKSSTYHWTRPRCWLTHRLSLCLPGGVEGVILGLIRCWYLDFFRVCWRFWCRFWGVEREAYHVHEQSGLAWSLREKMNLQTNRMTVIKIEK